MNDLTIDSRDAYVGVWISGDAKMSQLTFLTGAESAWLGYDSLYVEGGRIHAVGDGSVSLGGLLDVTAADEKPFDVTASTRVYLGGPLRVAGQVDNVSWLPPHVEFAAGVRCSIFAYEEAVDATTIHALPGSTPETPTWTWMSTSSTSCRCCNPGNTSRAKLRHGVKATGTDAWWLPGQSATW